ncbi:hypothetical protein [Runella sp.]|uniref:hypothetical protein n=1 Tax=Runella sp. TaxID=1960881 RepID=UPI003D13ABAC
MSGHFSGKGKSKEAKELEEDVKEKKLLFLTAFASTSKGYKFTTLSDNGSKLVTTIDLMHLIGTEVYEELSKLIVDINSFIEPKGTFYAKKFEVKKTDGMQMIYLEGSAPVGLLTADVSLNTFFDYEATKDLKQETDEDKAIFEQMTKRIRFIESMRYSASFSEQNFLSIPGLAAN